jgi:hypothetical protein
MMAKHHCRLGLSGKGRFETCPSVIVIPVKTGIQEC